MTGALRDYDAWHTWYDDPDSGLSWRLSLVQQYITETLNRRQGPLRVVSACAGDGRDLIGVLSQRPDASRVQTALLEIDGRIAERARTSAAQAGLGSVTVKQSDAALTESYVGLVPADLVLLVGIFGNISDDDIRRTIAMSPQLCAPEAAVIWSRGRDPDIGGDKNDRVRDWFASAGFVEVHYATRDTGSLPAVGLMRYDGPVQPLLPGRRMFTFTR